MRSTVGLSWKIVFTIPEDGPDYLAKTKLFNVPTAKNVLGKIGGITNCDFFPRTLDPTNVFYNALRKLLAKNAFFGKKLPFRYESEVTNSEEEVRIKLHLYKPKVVIASVQLSRFNFNADFVRLIHLQNIETHRRLYSLVMAICGLVESGNHRASHYKKKPKIYPCTLIIREEGAERVPDQRAVEILTRHTNPTSAIVQDVLKKNEVHQLDVANPILLDRQGIFANFDTSAVATLNRKYESTMYMLELAAAISRLLIQGQFCKLAGNEQISVRELIFSPKVVFTDSVTALRGWELLIKEFKLVDVFEKYVGQPNDNSQRVEVDKADWSDRKKWVMRIIGTLMIALLAAFVKRYWTVIEQYLN